MIGTRRQFHILKVLAAVACLAFGLACGEDRPPSFDDPPPGFDTPSTSLYGPVTPEDLQKVIPINGDSSAPVDEIMDAGLRAPIATLAAWHLSAPIHPVAIYTERADGDVDIRVLSPEGLSRRTFEQRAAAPVVLMPVAESSRAAIERYVLEQATRGSGMHVLRAKLHAYCVDARKRAAPAGALFVSAGAAVQRRFASVQGLVRVGDGAIERGILKPQGDPAAYGRFVTQYAVWTRLEGWDERRFTDEFIQRTRRTAEERHQVWTSETELTLRALAPGRWRDVQVLLQTAASVPTSGGGTQ